MSKNGKVGMLKTFTLQKSEPNIKYQFGVDVCPLCKITQQPELVTSRLREEYPSRLWVLYQCTNLKCQALFVAECEKQRGLAGGTNDYFSTVRFYPSPQREQFFPEIVSDISGDFLKIYNQSLQAESLGLTEICGPGYRKSLEFLVKDYCIHEKVTEESKIKKMYLGNCISELIDDPKIKAVASRAAWIGNDETHYERRWTNTDVKDLKILIRLTVNFVENNLLANHYSEEMPD